MPVQRSCETQSADAFAPIPASGDSWSWYPQNHLLEALAGDHALKKPCRHTAERWIPLLAQLGCAS